MTQIQCPETPTIDTLAERFIAEGFYTNIPLKSPFGTTDLKSFLVAFSRYSQVWGRAPDPP